MGNPLEIAALFILVNETVSMATPPLHLNPAPGPRSLDPTETVDSYGDELTIEGFPWHVFARLADEICSGIIIHKNWIILLESCTIDAGINAESNITVHASGETPERVQQVVTARVHPFNAHADPLEGVTFLRLETALVVDYERVQPARLSYVDETYTKNEAVAAGFSLNGTTDIHLKAFLVDILDCPNKKLLCARSDSDWPTENTHTRGTDYLEVTGSYDANLGEVYFCVVGTRKSTVENSRLVEYYPTLRMGSWIAKNLGLNVMPPSNNVSTPCGYIVDKPGQ